MGWGKVSEWQISDSFLSSRIQGNFIFGSGMDMGVIQFLNVES